MLKMQVLAVGEYETNCYLVSEIQGGEGILIDAGDQAEVILNWIGDLRINKVLLTHGHEDHVGALEVLRKKLDVPVGIHPADANIFHLDADFDLLHGKVVPIGDSQLKAVHIPGHTPGSVAFHFNSAISEPWAIVGDAIFLGGPGHTETPQDLSISIASLKKTVFTWADSTTLYPGHGGPTTVGTEREFFEAFVSKPWPEDLCGDVTWA